MSTQRIATILNDSFATPARLQAADIAEVAGVIAVAGALVLYGAGGAGVTVNGAEPFVTGGSATHVSVQSGAYNAHDGTAAITVADATGAIGMSKAATLTAAGTALTVNNNATVSGIATVGTMKTATIQAADGTAAIGIAAATGKVTLAGALAVATIQAADGTSAISLAAGTGKATFAGDVQVNGIEIIVGGVIFNGDVTFGDATTDNIAFVGRVGTNANPNFTFKKEISHTITADASTTISTVGSDITIVSAQGSAASGATAGGDGGVLTFQGGPGGAGTATGLAGAGAAVSISGGPAGTNNGGGGAIGGPLNLSGGNSSGAFAAGSVTVRGGAGTTTGQVFIGDVNTSQINIGAGSIPIAIQGSFSFTNGTFTVAGGAAAISIGADATNKTITFGAQTNTGAFTFDAGAATISMFASAAARTWNFGTGAAIQTVHLFDGGAANVLTIGSTTGAAAVTIQAGSAGITLTGAISTASNFTQTGATTFSTGTSTFTHNGAVSLASGVGITSAGGVAALNFGSSTGATTFATGAISWTAAAGVALTLTGSSTSTVTIDGQTANLFTSNIARTWHFGDVASIQTVHLFDGAAANVITLGSTTALASLTLQSGTGNMLMSTGNGTFTVNSGTGAIAIGADATVKTITLGSTSNTGTVTFDAGAATISWFTSNAVRTWNLGTGTSAQTVHLFDGAVANLVTIGSLTGAAALTLQAGSGNMLLSTATANGTVTINSGTGAIGVGTDAVAKTITVGNQTGATSVIIDCGTGALKIGSSAAARTWNIGDGAAVQTVNLFNGAAAHVISAGAAGAVWTITGFMDASANGHVIFKSAAGGGSFGAGIQLDATSFAGGKKVTLFSSGTSGSFNVGYVPLFSVTDSLYCVAFNLPNQNIIFGGTSDIAAGSGKKIFVVNNTTAAPSSNPTASGYLYSNAGAGTWRGTGGTITPFGPAGPHCGDCGHDAWTVAHLNVIHKTWHFECGECGAEFKSKSVDIRDQLTDDQRKELLYRDMKFEEVCNAMHIDLAAENDGQSPDEEATGTGP